MMVAQERCRQHIWTQEPSLPIHAAGTASSGSSLQLVDGVPPILEGQDGAVEQKTPRATCAETAQMPCKGKTNARRWRRRLTTFLTRMPWWSRFQ